ncbi:RNA polymerase sigma factor [Rhodocytophaga aerolata]|uniref:RNA polymerase sigma factor n=1 Tax=Rhodocytophaga aerolata TaxID=455078 RepID=A0ABT8REI5_9BACT|nr:RNA polymerase sigma factor [Rhodocytophaga aerolata]MDO1449140.1 RNA polymerase sigma factor [Rhodocytophaga aerolata]
MISVEEYNLAVKEYTRRIFRFLYKSLRDEEAVNDLVQDCYLKLWQNKDSVDPQKVKAWLFSVAYRAMLNYVKAHTRKVPWQEDSHAPAVFQKNEFDTRAILEKALNELPALQKSILLLRDLEGYEYKEIGEILGISEAQVKVYLFRARQKVKNYIKELTNVL